MHEKLILHQMEFEARMGFDPGKYTNPNKILSGLIAAMLTIGFYFGLHFLPSEMQQSRTVTLFTERGYIQFITTYAFAWGMSAIWIKSQKARVQTTALQLLIDRNFGCYRFSPDNAEAWHKWLTQLADKPQAFLILNRLRAAFASLANLKNPAQLPGMLNQHAESDEMQVEDSYSFIHMLLFAIPIIGFIGTVLGLGNAIGGFGETLSVGTENLDGLIGSLQGVAGGLSIAFDTTLLALIAALILQVYTAFERASETNFLEDCNFFMQNEFYPNLRSKSPPNEVSPWDPYAESE